MCGVSVYWNTALKPTPNLPMEDSFLFEFAIDGEMHGAVVLENETILLEMETCGSRSGVVRVLQQFVNEVGLVGILVHHTALHAAHGGLGKGIGAFLTVFGEQCEPLFFRFVHCSRSWDPTSSALRDSLPNSLQEL